MHVDNAGTRRQPPTTISQRWGENEMVRNETMTRRTLLGAGLALPSLGLLPTRPARAATPLKLGVLCDMSGIYADDTGPGLVAAVKVAVDQAGGKVGDRPIEIVSADDQNKPDV